MNITNDQIVRAQFRVRSACEELTLVARGRPEIRHLHFEFALSELHLAAQALGYRLEPITTEVRLPAAPEWTGGIEEEEAA